MRKHLHWAVQKRNTCENKYMWRQTFLRASHKQGNGFLISHICGGDGCTTNLFWTSYLVCWLPLPTRQIMEWLPAFPRQPKPKEQPNACHSPLWSFEAEKHGHSFRMGFPWPGNKWGRVGRVINVVLWCWCVSWLCVCVCVVCFSVGLQHWESGRAAGLLWDQAQGLGGGWVRLEGELHTHTSSCLSLLRVIWCTQTHTHVNTFSTVNHFQD